MHQRFILLALAFTVFIFFSCHSKNAQTVASQKLEILQPFDISYSQGGGLTGQVDSYHIASTGRIEHIAKMPGKNDSLIWTKEVSTNELAKLQESLTASGILQESLNEQGNITTRLTYMTADTAYILSWAGAGAMGDVSMDMKKWLAQLKNLLQQE